MTQRKGKWMSIIICVLFLSACANMQGGGVKSVADMTPKEKATWMMGIYNAQARDYKVMVARPDLTNYQKDILRKKKAIMTQVWPLINTYTAYVETGTVVTKDIEDKIIGLINDLTALALPLVSEGGSDAVISSDHSRFN